MLVTWRGQTADYEAYEMAIMRRLRETCDEAELALIHEVKATFAARILDELPQALILPRERQ